MAVAARAVLATLLTVDTLGRSKIWAEPFPTDERLKERIARDGVIVYPEEAGG